MRMFISSMVGAMLGVWSAHSGVLERSWYRSTSTSIAGVTEGSRPVPGSHVRHGAGGRRAGVEEQVSRLSENQQCPCKGATEGRLMSGAMTSYKYYADCIAINP